MAKFAKNEGLGDEINAYCAEYCLAKSNNNKKANGTLTIWTTFHWRFMALRRTSEDFIEWMFWKVKVILHTVAGEDELYIGDKYVDEVSI